MPDYTLAEIAAALGAEAVGDARITVTRAAEPAEAGPDALALAMGERYAEGLKAGGARAALLWEGADWEGLGLAGAIFVKRSRLALAGVAGLFDEGPDVAPGIHPTAVIDPTAEIGADAAIGPYVVIGAGVRIGDRARIEPFTRIARGARLGADARIGPQVTIGPEVTIGDRFIAQPGARIGGDGFSFVTSEVSRVELTRKMLGDVPMVPPQSWVRIASLGSVTLGDDVEVGANATIDRGTIRDTRIGHRTKIDNLVMIGHNVVVGEDCLLCAQTGIAGSAVVGDRVVMAGQTGVNDNITVGDDVVAGGASKLFTSVPAGRVILGHPAVKMDRHLEMYKALRRLPRALADLAALKKAVSKPTGND